MKNIFFMMICVLTMNTYAENDLGIKLLELAGNDKSASEIEDLIRENGPFAIDFKSYDAYGDNPVHAAIKNKYCENLKPILEYSNLISNFDINERDGVFHYSPLEFSAVNSYQQCIELLINFKGTNLNSFLYKTNTTVFQELVLNKNVKAVTKIVMQTRFDINQALPAFDGNHYLSWVISLKGDIDQKVENEISTILINNSAKVNFKNIRGQTPLMVSAYYDNLEIFKKLLNAKADISIKDNGNHSVLEYAKANNAQSIIKFIEEM